MLRCFIRQLVISQYSNYLCLDPPLIEVSINSRHRQSVCDIYCLIYIGQLYNFVSTLLVLSYMFFFVKFHLISFSSNSGNNTESLDQPPPTLPGNSIASSLPLSIIAGNRPYYLFRMLRGFLATPGVNKEMVTVYIDGYFKEVAGIAELFGVKYVFHDPICSGNCRISQVCSFFLLLLLLFY